VSDPILSSSRAPQVQRRAGVVFGVVAFVVFGVLPAALAVTVTVTPDRLSRPEPGGSFSYSIEVSDCDFGAAGCTLESLEDSVYGDLDGEGTCATGVDFGAPGDETYTCEFSGSFFGDAGDNQTNTITAEGVDAATGLTPFADGTGSSTVTITDSTRLSQRAFSQRGRQSSRQSRGSRPSRGFRDFSRQSRQPRF